VSATQRQDKKKNFRLKIDKPGGAGDHIDLGKKKKKTVLL